jgi:hypothetical protein
VVNVEQRGIVILDEIPRVGDGTAPHIDWNVLTKALIDASEVSVLTRK